MGISTVSSYRGPSCSRSSACPTKSSELCFADTVSRIRARALPTCRPSSRRRPTAPGVRARPGPGGLLKFVHGEEYHAYNPDIIARCTEAVRSGEWSDYEKFAVLVNERAPATLRRPC